MKKICYAAFIFILIFFIQACKKRDVTSNEEDYCVTGYTDSAGTEYLNTFFSNGLIKSSQSFYKSSDGEIFKGTNYDFTYNDQGRMESMLIDQLGNSIDLYLMTYKNENLARIDIYEKIKGYGYVGSIDVINMNNKFSKWRFYSYDTANIDYEISFYYGTDNTLDSLINSRKEDNVMVPREKYVFYNDTNKLADPRLFCNRLGPPYLYPVFNQSGAKQFNRIEYYSYYYQYELLGTLDYVNVYDDRGRLISQKMQKNKLYFNWSCK